MAVAAVIVAGGSGIRAGGGLPKQYQLIGGRPMIWWTLKAFLEHPAIKFVQAVINPEHSELFEEATRNLKLAPVIHGGANRQDSCRIGVAACLAANCSKVLIHDAARPFVSADLISRVVAELDHVDAVIPGMPVADTIKAAPGGVVERTVDRKGLWAVQTPQGFKLSAIHDAHQKAFVHHLEGLTDDASVAEAYGIHVRIISGREANRKLTTSEDMRYANEALARQAFDERPDIRMGQGIDFHEFTRGNSVTLCGVKIPHTHKLKGHSDADAAMHALTDALLGALGEGDIGTFFPPSDAQWKGAASTIFLRKAVELLHARNGIVANADITLLAEAPKIMPHVAAMKAVLTPLLAITPDRIAIKATTTEKLGAIGRKEGLAAFAIATIRLP
jgi:2-C-methyl-D-erythritol 4-phosphate cytidylyltransferase / 2-C-methyl-D-erythritol 2,4-cyclodiphosphate synthase